MKLLLSIFASAFFVLAPANAAEPVAADPVPAAVEVPAEAVAIALDAPADCAAAEWSTPAFLASSYCGRCSQHLCRGEDAGNVCASGRTCVVVAGVCSIGGAICHCV